MVNERTPAKTGRPDNMEEKASTPTRNGQDSVAPPAPLIAAPKFGQTSLPQSPFSKEVLERKILLQPKRRQPAFDTSRPQTTPPNIHAVKGSTPETGKPTASGPSVRGVQSSKTSANVGVPIARPVQPAYTHSKPVPQQVFGSDGTAYTGFTNNSGRPSNYIDLTTPYYRDQLAPEPYSFVDPVKAAADLQALLEGAIEDEDDVPRTRSRKKRTGVDADADGLAEQLQGLAVTKEEDNETADDEDDGTVEGIKVKLLPHQVVGLEWMRERELGRRKKGTVPKGGILADDMGLGKTLQAISLIITNPKLSAEHEGRKVASGTEKCTLVVAPLALIRQWEAEIKDKVAASHALRVCVHHGPQRTKRFQDLKRYDVVITTYQILVSEFGSSSTDTDGLKVGCFGLHWYRVVLDEAHTIKNRNAKATQACYNLRSEYRWCLTGTPMQNNLDELQSLIKFLRIKPYDDLREWKDQIDRPMKNGRGDVAIKRLQQYLKIFMKRRTKDILKEKGALNPGGRPSAIGGTSTPAFKVTERRIEKIAAQFSARERQFYKRLEQRTDKSLEEMMEGEHVNYASALVLLLRLRQACNHPNLVRNKLDKDKDAVAVDGSNAARSPSKKSPAIDVDDIADMFGGLSVGSKKCDVCLRKMSKELSVSGAIRCAECEEDRIAFDEGSKVKKGKKNRRHHHGQKQAGPGRKPGRNRRVIMDSDDENDAEWLVATEDRGLNNLGKAGGTDDENAEGEGISLCTEDSDETDDTDDTDRSDLPRVKQMVEKRAISKAVITIDSSDSEPESASEVEDEVRPTNKSERAKLATIVNSTKIKHLLEILAKEAKEHKFIVFSQFTSMLDLIEPFLKRDGYTYTRYDGSMRNDMREAALSQLRENSRCRVLLCSLKCGSLGLNLTAATRVVILEPFWNPFVEEQAIDRVHRLTQKTDVVVYKITIEDTVEERILELQEKKRELAEQAIEGSARANAGKLGMKEILQLFRREAEHTSPTRGDVPSFTGHVASRGFVGIGSRGQTVSTDPSREGSSERLSREGSVVVTGERRVYPGTKIKVKEDTVYGRRW